MAVALWLVAAVCWSVTYIHINCGLWNISVFELFDYSSFYTSQTICEPPTFSVYFHCSEEGFRPCRCASAAKPCNIHAFSISLQSYAQTFHFKIMFLCRCWQTILFISCGSVILFALFSHLNSEIIHRLRQQPQIISLSIINHSVINYFLDWLFNLENIPEPKETSSTCCLCPKIHHSLP